MSKIECVNCHELYEESDGFSPPAYSSERDEYCSESCFLSRCG